MIKNIKFRSIMAIFICLVVLFNTYSFAAIISDNDGSAFITKAEFEALKKDFNDQIDKYNESIDSKIDGAIASYLAGVNLSSKGITNNLQSGIIWSIGPFDRPRYKHGIPIWDMLAGRISFPDSSRTTSDINRATYMLLRSSWGSDFTNKTPIVNSAWAYRDIFLKNISSNGALYDGWYDLCGHWRQIWVSNNYQERWYDVSYEFASSVRLVPMLSPQGHYSSNEFWQGNFRPAGLNATDTVVHTSANPYLGFWTSNGNVNYSTVTKGNQMLWDKNVSVFGPISYQCFNEEHNNRPSDPNPTGSISASSIRDEINYITLTNEQMSTYNNYTGTNFLYRVLPDRNNYADNPWNKSSLSSPISDVRYALHIYHSDTDKSLLNETQPFDATKGMLNTFFQSPTTFRFYQHVYIQEPTFVSQVTNWNKTGREIQSSVKTYLDDNSLTSQLLTLSDKSKALSLAAGVPISVLEKNRKVTIKGEFRKNCRYVYNASTITNTLDEGSLDDTDAYVVYAKYKPFDITGMPEDDSELIDISPTTKDTDNKGKLTKCRIVRNGKINIEFENYDNKDKIIFLKWEKLSNWNAARTARRTGAATNTDVHKMGTTTGETIAPPTWTYFGGGYAKFDDTFEWEDID